MNLYLIGYRGVGKTTAAPRAAALLSRSWIDLDDEIERHEGAPVAALFAKHGEEWFREREARALERAAGRSDLVVATGGGAVIRGSNQAVLRRGACVWLRASPATILDRLRADAHRPRLSELPLDAETALLLSQREPIYVSLAAAVVDVEEKSPDEISAEVAAAYRRISERSLKPE